MKSPPIATSACSASGSGGEAGRGSGFASRDSGRGRRHIDLRGADRFVASLPASSAIVELPLGEPAFDVRYMFYSTRHWKPLVNGYSGGEPDDYARLNFALQDLGTRPERAWSTLVASTATHAIVHEQFYAGDRGARVSAWLRSNGATEIATFGSNRVFALQ